MKRFTSILLAALLLTLCVLTGCSNKNNLDNNTQSAWNLADAEPIYVTEWPENDYTSQVVKPEHGEIDYVFDLSDSGRYALFLKEISEEESNEYINRLKQSGYSEIISKGNEVSLGTMLKKDNTILNIALSDGILAMIITIEQ